MTDANRETIARRRQSLAQVLPHVEEFNRAVERDDALVRMALDERRPEVDRDGGSNE